MVVIRDIAHLKAKERSIAQEIAAGLSTEEIARKLRIKSGTVRNYVSLILHKTGLQHRTQIALLAYRDTDCPAESAPHSEHKTDTENPQDFASAAR
jgi:DNA-binding CsgD family transcriptional regulator